MFNVLLDMGKLKNPNSGLGQFSYYYGKHISELENEELHFNFLIPESKMGIFGKDYGYENTSLLRRIAPYLCKKYDLWHALHQDSSFLPANTTSPYILTIHDLNFLEEKGPFKARRRLRKLQKKVDRASAITFISNYTAKISRENLNLEGKRTFVIHNGVDIEYYKVVPKPDYLPSGKYLLALGMVLKKKNFHVLIDLMDKLEDCNLVIAGDNSSEYARMIINTVNDRHLHDRVFLPGIVSENDKIFLYKNCSAFLFPSRVEGFGLPVIEAMRFGKPVFISNKASLPEIGGDLAFYWNNFNPDYMADIFKSKIKEYEENEDDMKNSIIEYSKKYDWKKSIKRYYDLYLEVLNNQN
jgi:glycosyltransferase involved in cell wall biosynthesis